MVLVLEIQRNVHFDLVVLSETLLVNDVADDSGSPLRIQGAGNHHFIFREGFFGNQRAWKVQLAPWPSTLAAESTQIVDHLVDLFGCKRFFERRHDVRKAAITATVGDHRFPGPVIFRSGLVALGEVWKSAGRFETGSGLWSAGTVRAVARDAGGFVNRFAGIQSEGRTRVRLAEQQSSSRNQDQYAECEPHRQVSSEPIGHTEVGGLMSDGHGCNLFGCSRCA